jgi:transposase-like protein
MRLNLILPKVTPWEFEKPKKCADPNCKGKQFRPYQEVKKNIRDTKYEAVKAIRYKCSRCGRTFRVYPKGVSQKHISQRVGGMAIMLYILGLSYGATAIVLEALGVGIGKTTVYTIVQAAAEKVPGLKREKILTGYQTKALGADVTSVRCKGKWLPLGISVDATQGVTLSIDDLEGEDADRLKEWLEPIMETVDADVLVTDDADAFKYVADETGRSQQVCKSHVVRNTETLVAELSDQIRQDRDRSLQDIGVAPEQALADLAALKDMIHSRNPNDQAQLELLYDRYANARKPYKGKYTVAYRMRNLFLDRWNLWPRLTFYRTWENEYGNSMIDGTNNGCERSIGWWVKERYRTMRGYKRIQSVLNISRLIAHAGNHLHHGLDLATLMA